MNESEARRRMLIQNARAQSTYNTYSFPIRKGTLEERGGGSFRTRLMLSILCFFCFVAFDSANLEVAKVNSKVILRQIEENLTMETFENFNFNDIIF